MQRMNMVSKYISHALILNDCVILPNFGGFVCHNEAAYIDELNGLLVPATKSITFNASLKHSDNQLAKFIANIERIPLNDAELKLERYIQDLNTCIERYGEVSIAGVGNFKMDNNDLRFKSENRNYMPATAYMYAIKLPMPALHVKATIQETEKRSINIGKIIARTAAAAAVVTLIAGAISFGNDKLEIFKHNRTEKASFELTFPFFPTTPQVSQCSSVISPECDYLDFISDL